MDVAYNQHSHYNKRHDRSHTNLGHLSLAPLTSRLPLNDAEDLPDVSVAPRLSRDHRFSYIEGRSAPTTPGILSRSSSRTSLRRTRYDALPKSKSITHIDAERLQKMKSKPHTPGGRTKRNIHDDMMHDSLTAADRNDSDWLLRAGALISSETRESNGQSWLVSRASSTSLTGERDEEYEEYFTPRGHGRERSSRLSSRRGSAVAAYGDADDEISPVTTRSMDPGSRVASRYGSRPSSRKGSKLNLLTPLEKIEKDREGYFDAEVEVVTRPDFVDVSEEEYDADQALEDELAVKRLAKAGTLGFGTWVERLMGWTLFDVEEDGEDTDVEANTETADGSESLQKYDTIPSSHTSASQATDGAMLPPNAEEGGWHDAAWLLSVATKVLL